MADYKLEEYKMLREEIMYNQKVENTAVQFTYTMIAALWAASFAHIGNEWIIFVSLIIIIPISLRVWYSRQSMAFLATYMSTFLEDSFEEKDKFNWETRHIMYYNEFGRTKSEKFVYYSSRLDFTLLSVAGTLLFWILRGWIFIIHGSILYAYLILLFQLCIISVELFLSCKYTNMSKLKEKKIKNWEKLRDKIQKEAE